ncbi:dioxygenase [Sulfolobales archaeon HS-7]|nr:dioxygenase [Sulfolobales archaeon HS-7]
MKALFVSHGSPMILVEKNSWKELLSEIGKEFADFDRVVIVSPHFATWDKHYVEVQERLECIQDYYGFPEELYKFCYSAPNDVEFAEAIVRGLEREGIPVKADTSWGLDHGAWIPLMYMFPFPKKVVTVSITPNGPEEHVRIGEVIGSLADDKTLVIGTGSPTHRLDLMYMKVGKWNSKFDAMLMELINQGDVIGLLNLPSKKEWIEAQPEGDLAPFYVALGSSSGKKGRVLSYTSPEYGVSMLAVEFD